MKYMVIQEYHTITPIVIGYDDYLEAKQTYKRLNGKRVTLFVDEGNGHYNEVMTKTQEETK